jgi:hypothetical protein
VEAYRVVRRWGSHIVWPSSSQMAVRWDRVSAMPHLPSGILCSATVACLVCDQQSMKHTNDDYSHLTLQCPGPSWGRVDAKGFLISVAFCVQFVTHLFLGSTWAATCATTGFTGNALALQRRWASRWQNSCARNAATLGRPRSCIVSASNPMTSPSKYH